MGTDLIRIPLCWALLPLMLAFQLSAQVGKIPEGFTPLFDGKTTAGWHWSRTVHYGSTAKALVEKGELVLSPYPYGPTRSNSCVPAIREVGSAR